MGGAWRCVYSAARAGEGAAGQAGGHGQQGGLRLAGACGGGMKVCFHLTPTLQYKIWTC